MLTKRTREEKKKLAVRIVALVMAGLMILGAAYTAISFFAMAASAEEINENYSQVLNTSSLKDSGDVLVSVGLMYGSNITTGFKINTSSPGYSLGIQYLGGDREFFEIWEVYDTVLSCTSDGNLSNNNMTFAIEYDPSKIDIGAYHVQIDCDIYDRQEFEDFMYSNRDAFANLGLDMIPSYIYTGYALRLGAFSSYDEAGYYLGHVQQLFPEHTVSVVGATKTAVSLVNPYSSTIVFEYDCGADSELGIKSLEDTNGNTYIETPAGNVYDGVFAFKRYNNGTIDGVSLINILPLEAYIAGVLPYETSNAWPIETEKAFAITVRSFTLTHLNKHSKYNFDLCNTTDCQVYKGAGRINELVMEAVLGTRGKVMTYDGNIVTAYYSSSVGGVTVSAQDCWGGKDVPYLQAVETPWEKYTQHSNAFWITEISPSALLERLHKAGYEELRGEIESVEITDLAKNSTYVKQLTVTDIYGTTVVINNTDKVRTSLTPYVKSANFVIGKGSVEYSENVVIADSDGDDNDDSEVLGGSDATYDKDYGYINLDTYHVITSQTEEKTYREKDIQVITADGEITHEKRDIFLMAKENAAAYLGDEYLKYNDKEEEEDKFVSEIIPDKSTSDYLYKKAYAEDSDNFIIVGKGWGHGVGMSQYGAKDLAGMGYNAEEILRAYFKGIDIIDYTRIN